MGETSGIFTLVFSPNGKMLASGGDDGTIRFWDVETGDLLKTVDTGMGSINAVSYSPDGKTLVSSGFTTGDDIRLWDVETGGLLKTINSHAEAAAYFVVYSPDGDMLVSGNLGEISFWSVETGERLKTFTGHIGPVYSVAFSLDGKTLVSGCRDSTVILWDLTQ